jgi:hypothetical protein
MVAVGVTLGRLSIHSTGADWVEAFIGEPSQLLYKVRGQGR